VTLTGAGIGQTTIAGSDPITLLPGSPATTLRGARIESASGFGVRAEGPGSVAIEDVEVIVSLGVGLGVRGVDSVSIADVVALGPVDASNASAQPSSATPDPASSATHGAALDSVRSASVTGLTVAGFAYFGVLSLESDLDWAGGDATGNLGAGVMVSGGTATIEEVVVCGTLLGARALSFALLSVGATLETRAILVCESASFGVFQQGGSATHVDLVSERNEGPGLHAQNGTSTQLGGAGTALTGNRFSALTFVDASGVSVRDASIEGTARATRVFGEVGTIMIGDGIHLVRTSGITIEGVRLEANERAGLFIDGGGAPLSGFTATSVTVDAAGAALGAVMQNGSAPPGWDDGIVRLGVTEANDASFGGMLDAVGAIGPKNLPIAVF
jgi:hypothetical protein